MARGRLSAVTLSVFGGTLVGGFALLLGQHHHWEHRWLISAIVAATFAGMIGGSIRYGWSREGGFVDTEEVDGWVRDRRLPDDVPLGAALSRLARRGDRIRMAIWGNSAWLILSLIQFAVALEEPSLVEVILRTALSALFAATLASAIYKRLRTVPVLDELILEGQRRFAGIRSS